MASLLNDILPPLDDEELQRIYTWVDEIPLSRPKRNIARDFSDAVLMAEIIHHYFPRFVDLHNYSAANSKREKLNNWSTLNQKVLRKMGFQLPPELISDICDCSPLAVESALQLVQSKMAAFRLKKRASSAPRHPSRPINFGDGGNSARSSPTRPQSTAQKYFRHSELAANAIIHRDQHQIESPNSIGQGTKKIQSHPDPVDQKVDASLLLEKEQTIQELRDIIEILELKIKQIEHLLRVKDKKIEKLKGELQNRR